MYEHRIARQEIDVSLDGTSLVSTALGWLPYPKAYYTGPMRILRLVSLTTVNHFSPIVIDRSLEFHAFAIVGSTARDRRANTGAYT